MPKFFLALSMMLLLFAISPIVKAESNTEWKRWTPKTDVDIDKEWVIQFSDEIEIDPMYYWRDWDKLYQNIYVVRERDNKRMFVEPHFPNFDFENDKKTVKVYLSHLYDFNETYYLYIKDIKSFSGNTLKEPTKMEFKTINPEFNIEQTVEKDGIEFHVSLSQTDEKIYTKVKATNVTEETIHVGKWECDNGLVTNLISKNDTEQVRIGSKWHGLSGCPTGPTGELPLEPGETIEVLELLYPPTQPLNENSYVKVSFRKVQYKELASGSVSMEYTPIEIEIPIHLK